MRALMGMLFAGLFLMGILPRPVAADELLYELRVYTCNEGKLEALHQRFRDGEAKLFEKHGMKNIAYWTPSEGDKAGNTLIYIVAHKDAAAAKASWDGFRADQDWHALRDASEKDGKLVGKVESTMMKLIDYSGHPSVMDPAMLYELRIYVTNEGRLDALNTRFREHTTKLFEKHGMANIAYWVPADEPKSKNTLIYVIAHKDRDASKTSWQGFRDDADWKRIAKESEKDGKILAEPPTAIFMTLMDYSPKK